MGRADRLFEGKSDMDKRQLIEEIKRFNTTVPTPFLTQFDECALKQYLEHLEGAFKQHARISTWVRKTPRLRMVS
jgi:aspartate aminotransferase-like enzyme